jgi:hypothetical protein
MGGFVGKEFTNYGPPKTIYLGEFNIGSGARGLGGISRGAGLFYTCDEAGFYMHGTLHVFGHEVAVGIGFGANH